MKYSLLYMLIATCFVSSCRKDKSSVPPVISILSPKENNSFTVFDTIKVEAEIKGDAGLVSASIQLLEADLTPALGLRKKNISGTQFTFREDYIIYDSKLASGIFYLKISAADGSNETREYVKINLLAAPVSGAGIALFANPSPFLLKVSLLNPSFQITPFVTLNCEYISSSASGPEQYLNLLSGNVCGLTSYNLEEKTVRWNIPAQGSQPYFTHLGFYNETSYVCHKDGKIRGYDKDGNIQFSANSNAGFYPVKLFLHGEELLVEEKEIAGNNRRISVFYNTGAYFESLAVPGQIVAFAGKENNEVLLFLNNNGTGEVHRWQRNQNVFNYTYVFPGNSPLRDAVQINSNSYVIAMPDALYKYSFSPLNFIKYIDFAGAERLRYDELNNRLMVAGGNMLKVYNYATGEEIISYQHNDPIRDFLLLYNR